MTSLSTKSSSGRVFHVANESFYRGGTNVVVTSMLIHPKERHR